MLPDEQIVRAELQSRFAEAFQGMSELLSFAVGVVTAGEIRLTRLRGVDSAVVQVALGLYVKACKQFRSILVLCEHGFGEDAHALTRNLFETAIALVFVLRHRVTLRSQGKTLPRVKGKPLTAKLRARLYVANIAFEHERTLNEWERTKGLRHAAKTLDKKGIPERVNAAEKAIGREWADRLKKRRTYSGTTVKDLALTLGLTQAYATLYRSASWSTHATDLTQFVRLAPQAGTTLYLSPGDAWVPPTIRGASLLLVISIEFLNERFGLGHEERIQEEKHRLGFAHTRGRAS
jgi:hypothetical protein